MISVTLDREMPKCCWSCPFARADDEMDFARCAFIGHISEWFYYKLKREEYKRDQLKEKFKEEIRNELLDEKVTHHVKNP